MCSLQIIRCSSPRVAHHLLRKPGLLREFAPVSASFSTSSTLQEKKNYKLLVVGGGAGGLSIASTFCRKLGKGKVAVIEPSDTHYSQATFTLVGTGIRTWDRAHKKQKSVMPKACDWIQDRAMTFDPDTNTVTTENGTEIQYDYLVVAMGLQLNYHLIKGLPEAFDVDPMLCSNYSPKTVTKTYPAILKFKEGNALFTCPNTPIKCPGAAQKIIYLTEEHFRKLGKRDDANLIYNTSGKVIFGVKKYAEPLERIIQERNIKVNFRHNLIEVIPEKKEAVFEKVDTGEHVTFPYSFMHITPPMSTPDPLRVSPLVDDAGYVTVDKETLQHTKYPNIFAIGDNTNVPTSKTAAAVASQSGAVSKNLSAVMEGKSADVKKYNGYTSCPLLTGSKKCILAEFDWHGNPMETFPFDQSKERRLMYHMKKDLLPPMYWKMLIRGLWRGPGIFRNAFHKVGLSRPAPAPEPLPAEPTPVLQYRQTTK